MEQTSTQIDPPDEVASHTLLLLLDKRKKKEGSRRDKITRRMGLDERGGTFRVFHSVSLQEPQTSML